MSQSWYQQDPNAVNQYRVIPNAGVYLQSQAQAQSAYERAVAQLKAQKAQRQIQSGMGQDWSVDPKAQYGMYQQMLQGQGGQLQQAEEQAQQRGFFGPGLGHQGESALRYGNAVEALGFKNQLTNWENEYVMGMGEAQRQKEAEMRGALQSSMANAVDDSDYTLMDPGSTQVLGSRNALMNALGPWPGGTPVKSKGVSTTFLKKLGKKPGAVKASAMRPKRSFGMGTRTGLVR